ncbi:hypothetical protein KM043_013733 [Ampulex compressa]|nr:hypothetical protein KM043_013733 [Ampulex compressa]
MIPRLWSDEGGWVTPALYGVGASFPALCVCRRVRAWPAERLLGTRDVRARNCVPVLKLFISPTTADPRHRTDRAGTTEPAPAVWGRLLIGMDVDVLRILGRLGESQDDWLKFGASGVLWLRMRELSFYDAGDVWIMVYGRMDCGYKRYVKRRISSVRVGERAGAPPCVNQHVSAKKDEEAAGEPPRKRAGGGAGTRTLEGAARQPLSDRRGERGAREGEGRRPVERKREEMVESGKEKKAVGGRRRRKERERAPPNEATNEVMTASYTTPFRIANAPASVATVNRY